MKPVVGPSSFVPVRNIWLLQVYASKLYQDGLIQNSDVEDPGVDLPHLASALLCDAVQRCLRKGLSRDFMATSRDTSRVRGRIDLLSTERRSLLRKGRVACTYNELSADTPGNRMLRHALDVAAQLTGSTPGGASLSQRCRHLSRLLVDSGVDPRKPSAPAPPTPDRRVLPHHAAASAAAQLVLDLVVPDLSAHGTRLLQSPIYSEEALRKLFEQALVGIYRHHLKPSGWRIKGAEKLTWNAEGETGVLPSMQTDISMFTPEGDKIIADAKFTGMTVTHRNKEILKPHHLYQLHAYITQSPTPEDALPTGGVLIYASVGADLRSTMRIGDNPFRCCTVDLTSDGPTIRNQALAAVENLW